MIYVLSLLFNAPAIRILLVPWLYCRRRPSNRVVVVTSVELMAPRSPSPTLPKGHYRSLHRRPALEPKLFLTIRSLLMLFAVYPSLQLLKISCRLCAPTAKLGGSEFVVVNAGNPVTSVPLLFSYMLCRRSGTSVKMPLNCLRPPMLKPLLQNLRLRLLQLHISSSCCPPQQCRLSLPPRQCSSKGPLATRKC